MCQDLRSAFRTLTHSRAQVGAVVGSLTIGMAVAVGALSFLNTLLFRPLPGITAQDRVVRVALFHSCGAGDCWSRLSTAPDYEALRTGLPAAEDVAAYTTADVVVRSPQARSTAAVFASANYFRVLGTSPALGRPLSEDDERDRRPVALIAHRLWTNEFAADPGVLGRWIRVADRPVEIVGVAPPHFIGVDHRLRGPVPDFWLPLWMSGDVAKTDAGRAGPSLQFVARMRSAGELPQIEAQATVLATALARARPGGTAAGRAEIARIAVGNPRNRNLTALLLLPVPLLVLAIACLNAANLMLARGSARQREIAICLALGAGRGRIVRQLLVESAVLAAISMGLAISLAAWALDFARTPLHVPVPIDRNVLTAAIAVVALTTVAFGLAPALRATRAGASYALAPAAAQTGVTPRQGRARRTLLVVQVALSVGLLATGWQLVATVMAQVGSSGATPDRLLLAKFDLQPLGLPPPEIQAFYARLMDEASRLPDVEAVGLARHTAVWTFGRGKGPASVATWTTGRPMDDGQVHVGGYVAGRLFEAVGLRVLQGRTFDEADHRTPPRVAVVDQVLATRLGPALGRTIRVAPSNRAGGPSQEVEIVGIIEPVLEPRSSDDGEPLPRIYIPAPVSPEPALTLYVRSRAAAAGLAAPLEQLVADIDPRVPVLEIGSLADLNERSIGPQLWLARAAAMLGAIGLALAAAGLYGVASFIVALRAREIAIRMAIGAGPRRVLAMMLVQSLRVAGLGLVIGGGIAVAVSRLIRSQFHGVQGVDAVAFAGSAILFTAAMLLASAIPALRASRVDPVATLKQGT